VLEARVACRMLLQTSETTAATCRPASLTGERPPAPTPFYEIPCAQATTETPRHHIVRDLHLVIRTMYLFVLPRLLGQPTSRWTLPCVGHGRCPTHPCADLVSPTAPRVPLQAEKQTSPWASTGKNIPRADAHVARLPLYAQAASSVVPRD